MLHIYCIFCSSLLSVYRLIATIIKNHAILQHLYNRSTLMMIRRLQHLNSMITIIGNSTCKEMASCAKCQLGWAERIFHSTVRTRFRHKATRTGWRILTFSKSVDTIVEQNHIDIYISAVSMNKMVTTNGKSITIARNLPNGKFWIHHLNTGSNCCCTTMNSLHSISIHVIRQTT